MRYGRGTNESTATEPDPAFDGDSAAPWLGAQSLTAQLGHRMGADTIIYALASGSALVVSLGLLIVYTHYMQPSEYGRLSVLFFSAGLFTMVLNLIPLAGILRWVYVSGDAAVGAADDPDRQAPGGTKRRALGTGCWMTGAFMIVGAALLIPFADPITKLLVGSGRHREWVLLAIASGAAGSLFRVTSNVVRMERRPVAFSLILTARGVVAAAVSVPLVVSGDGINGALLGTIVGSLVPGIVAVWIARTSYSTDFSWTDARQITDLGSKYIFVILGLFVVHNGDSFVLSRFASYAQVGVYRVATRLSSIVSYLVSAFLLAWAPLERSSLFQATYQMYGKAQVHKQMVTYYLLSGLTLTLALTLSGDLLVRLSPPHYRGAANLIPFASFGFVIYGLFILIARTTAYKHRDFVHNASAALAAVVYVAAAAVLVPRWGGYGLAISMMIGMSLACACFRAIIPWATHYAPIDWPRAIGASVIVVACIVIGDEHFLGNGVLRVGLLLADMLVIYPAAVIGSGIVSRQEALTTARLLWGLVPFRPAAKQRSEHATVVALSKLAPEDLLLLRRLTKDRARVADIAADAGVPVSVVEAQAGRILRQLTETDGSERDDATIGNWLFSGKSSAEHDVVMYYLERYGIKMLSLQQVEAAALAARSLPIRSWPLPADVRIA